MSSNKIYRSVGIDKTVAEVLARMAASEDRSFSALVSRILRDYCMSVGEKGAKEDAN